MTINWYRLEEHRTEIIKRQDSPSSWARIRKDDIDYWIFDTEIVDRYHELIREGIMECIEVRHAFNIDEYLE